MRRYSNNVFVALLIILLISTSPSGHAQSERIPLDPPVLMPNGSEFLKWENTTSYSKTYVVNQKHPSASDENSGTEEQPFKTINRAAQVVKAGERVLIRSGVYREKVVPQYGGTAPDAMISYEAGPDEEVIIKGSRVLDPRWTRSLNPTQFSEKLWMITLPDSIFSEKSPFKIQNAGAEDIEIMPWAAEWKGRIPYTLPRGMVFQDGKRLVQLACYEDLVRVPGSYWVDSTGTVIHVHAFGTENPNESTMEVTVQQHFLKPDKTYLSYIQVKGIYFQHAGNGFPRTGVGALFTKGGHHWIIEENRFNGINSVAIEIGALLEETPDRTVMRKRFGEIENHPGQTIVRNNEVSDCGTGGIQGMVNRNVLVEKNHLHHIGWQDVERYWECAAIKLLLCNGVLVQQNLIHDCEAGNGIWLDWDNHNCRITKNVVYDLRMWGNGALFIEASQVLNLIDHNIVWNIQGGAIYCGDTDSLLIAHNLIGPCTKSSILMEVNTDRTLNGRKLTSRHHRVMNNIFYETPQISIEDPDNYSDLNLFSNDYKLPDAQNNKWDLHSKRHHLKMSLNRENLKLQIESDSPLPLHALDSFFIRDFSNSKRVESAYPGPFEKPLNHKMIIDIDPRYSQ